MGPWGSAATPASDSGYGNVHDDDRETLRFADEGEYAYDPGERPCGCRTENRVFMPCADHVVSDLRT